MPSSEADRREEESAPAEDEDTGAQIAPIVRLEEVSVTTGEEDEEVLLDLKAKLYRFDKDGNQWKERGTGTVKLLKHRTIGKIRLVMRQSKTLKVCASHNVGPSIKIQEHVGNDKSCVWHASDFSDGELKAEMFCIRFPSVDNCKKFKETIEEVADSLGREEAPSEEADSAAELVEALNVSSSASDEKKGEEKAEAAEKSV